MLFDENDTEHVTESKEKPPTTDLNGPEWTSLPKKLWVIWDSGFEDAPIVNQLMIKNIIQKARKYGLNATLVTRANLHLFVGKKIVNGLDNVCT